MTLQNSVFESLFHDKREKFGDEIARSSWGKKRRGINLKKIIRNWKTDWKKQFEN